MNRDPDMDWLERAAAGAREVLADYRTMSLRGTAYPDSTEQPADIDHLLKAAEIARQNVLYNLDFLRRTDCAECGREEKLEREWGGERMLCPRCRENAEVRAQEHRSEERYRKASEFRRG